MATKSQKRLILITREHYFKQFGCSRKYNSRYMPYTAIPLLMCIH